MCQRKCIRFPERIYNSIFVNFLLYIVIKKKCLLHLMTKIGAKDKNTSLKQILCSTTFQSPYTKLKLKVTDGGSVT